MKDPASGNMLCVNCDHTYPAGADLTASAQDQDEGEDEDEDKVEDEDKDLEFASAPDMSVSAWPARASARLAHQAPVSRGQTQSDKVASLLSEKMLQGWALLETTCPRCSSPLVRNKQKRMRCVLCDAWVVSEADAPAAPRSAAPHLTPTLLRSTPGPSDTAQPLATKQMPGTPPGMPACAGPLGQTPTQSLVGDSPHGALGPGGAEAAVWTQHAPAAAPAGVPPSPMGCEAGGVLSMAAPRELLAALSGTLHDKLWQAQRLLADTPASAPAAVRGYAAMVSECLDTLSKLRHEARMLTQHGAGS